MVHKLAPRVTGAFFIIIILLSGCLLSKSSISEDEKNTFINTYAGLVLIQIKYDKLNKFYDQAEQAIFEENSTTREEFEQFEQKISSNPELQKEIYTKIIEKLKEYKDTPVDSLNIYIRNLTLERNNKFK